MIRLFFVFFATLCLTGCSTGKSYWKNRGDDALDVFTFSIGRGMFAKLQAGPLHLGPYYNYSPVWGVQSGEVFTAPKYHSEYYHNDEGNVGGLGVFMNSEIFLVGKRTLLRHKAYSAVTPMLPVLLPDTDHLSKKSCNACQFRYLKARYLAQNKKDKPLTEQELAELQSLPELGGKMVIAENLPFPWYLYSDINLFAGAFWGFRVGFNPGEFLDLLAGFCYLDLYGDDL